MNPVAIMSATASPDPTAALADAPVTMDGNLTDDSQPDGGPGEQASVAGAARTRETISPLMGYPRRFYTHSLEAVVCSFSWMPAGLSDTWVTQ